MASVSLSSVVATTTSVIASTEGLSKEVTTSMATTTALESLMLVTTTPTSSLLSVSNLDATVTTMAGILGKIFYLIFHIIPSILYWVITFSTITVPTSLFTLFSMTLTFTMNFTTLLLILLVVASTVSWFIRYRYLNMYSRLPSEPQRKEPQIDLFPDSQEGDSKPGLSNYLDEFLSAIKVFGYLERPVFHELTRTMQTRKLMAGETLLLEEEKGFCLVVNGLVQVFVKSTHNQTWDHVETVNGYSAENSEDDELHQDDGHQGYQLLTEVKNGAAMSSLFSVLKLFTEDIRLRHQQSTLGDESEFAGNSIPNSPRSLINHSRPVSQGFVDVVVGQESLPPVPPLNIGDSHLHHPAHLNTESDRPLFDSHGEPSPYVTPPPNLQNTKSVHPDIVARAVVDTTIAIIPASAFRRLTRVYPRATANIIQVILTRLQRVTFSTAHSYLGLNTEVLSIEKQLNRFTAYDLPNDLRGNALVRLKAKFSQERDRLGPEDGSKGIALHNPATTRRRRSSSTLRKEAAFHARILASHKSVSGIAPERTPLRNSIADTQRAAVNPGDLLSSIQFSRSGSHLGPQVGTSTNGITSPLAETERSLFHQTSLHVPTAISRPEGLDEDILFRDSILECMMKALGLTASTRDVLRKAPSGEASPRLVSYDAKRQKALFSNVNHAFGFIDPYDDADTESTFSISVTSAGGTSPILSLKEELRSDIEIVSFPEGTVLVEHGERNPGLYYVIDGFLDVGVPVNDTRDEHLLGHPVPRRQLSSDDFLSPLQRPTANSPRASGSGDPKRRKKSRRSLYLIKPGHMQGYVEAVASYRSFTDVVAKTDVYVGFLPRAALERIAERYPLVLLTLAKRLTSVLPRLILHIDFALEWVHVSAGQVIHHQGDESDAIHIVLNGRLRSVLEKPDGKMEVMGEYGQGESVGELEVMTESTRPATLHAIRDTELAKFPRSLFNSLAQEHPGITIQISKLIAQRMRNLVDDRFVENRAAPTNSDNARTATSTVNLRTVTILPVTTGVPVVEFAYRLVNAFHQVGVINGVTSLNHAAILNHLGRHAFSKLGKLKLSQYLADLEEKYGMVLYIADTTVNAPWTQTCISQADCILLVGLAEGSASIGEYERFLLGMKTTARKELVLLHSERYCPPGVTRRWLKNRMWINGGHHHIQMAYHLGAEPALPQAKKFGTALKQRVQVIQAEIQKYTSRRIRHTPLYSAQTPFKGDFHRLARRLCGKSVGLVLGGGGARGIAHIGVIKALEEAGIPIDIVGGTSIGAFIGALYARDADVVPMYGRAKKFAGRMGSMWRFALDLTYPSVSYTTGHEFNRGIFKTFGDSQIEDFWLEFYCNTTNISKSRNEFHSSGYVWRYVRASMSLAGLLPPLCDEGNLLLDGGYLDNLTVAHMKGLGAQVIIAIDVGSIDDQMPQSYGDSLSGFWTFLNRWNPFSATPNPLTLSEIQARLAYVSSVDNLERAKITPGCLYIRPPIDAYGTLDFGRFDEIYQVGYAHAKEYLERLKNEGNLPIPEETTEERKMRRTMAPRRASI